MAGGNAPIPSSWPSTAGVTTLVLSDFTALWPPRRAVRLAPRHSAGLVAMWEDHDRGRIGFEAYHTGTQPLDDNPYRDRGKAYGS